MDQGERQEMEQRLHLLRAVLAATERRHEVADAVYESASAADAAWGVAELLGLSDEEAAMAVLDMQTRRLTRHDRRELAGQVRELEDRLGQSGPT